MRHPFASAVLVCLLGLVFSSCRREAEVLDACDEDESWCIPCSSGEECRFVGNPCLETVYCAHVQAGIATVEIGCDEAVEYSWPADEECGCQGTCKFGGGGAPP